MRDDPSLFEQVFNQRGALLAIFGALGGAVRAAALQVSWRSALRDVGIGSATAFGFGAISPHVLRPWLGDLPMGAATDLGVLCAVAFATGLTAMTLIRRFVAHDTGDRQ